MIQATGVKYVWEILFVYWIYIYHYIPNLQLVHV